MRDFMMLGLVSALAACGGSSESSDAGGDVVYGHTHDGSASISCHAGPVVLTSFPNAPQTAVIALAVDDSDVYWLQSNGDLVRAPKTGGATETVYTNNTSTSSLVGQDLVDDGTSVYVSDNLDIVRFDKASGHATVLFDDVSHGTETSNLAAFGDSLYAPSVSMGGGLLQIAKADGSLVKSYATNNGPSSRAVVDATEAFVTTYPVVFEGQTLGAWGLWRVPLDGSSAPAMISTISTKLPMALDATSIYLVAGDVLQVDRATATRTLLGSGDATTANVVVDDWYAYWAAGNAIWIRSKLGGPAAKLADNRPANVIALDSSSCVWWTEVTTETISIVGAPKPK